MLKSYEFIFQRKETLQRKQRQHQTNPLIYALQFFFFFLTFSSKGSSLRLRLVEVKIGWMENEERKTGEKMMFSLVWYKKENTKDGKC